MSRRQISKLCQEAIGTISCQFDKFARHLPNLFSINWTFSLISPSRTNASLSLSLWIWSSCALQPPLKSRPKSSSSLRGENFLRSLPSCFDYHFPFAHLAFTCFLSFFLYVVCRENRANKLLFFSFFNCMILWLPFIWITIVNNNILADFSFLDWSSISLTHNEIYSIVILPLY